MSAGEKVASNQMVLTMILEQLSSQDLLPPRLVSKFWMTESNRLIRLRQEKFFLSPSSTTKSTEGYNDLKWKQSMESVLQISFAYSMWRNTFIRVSRRLLDAHHPALHLEASTSAPDVQRGESAFFQEVEHYDQEKLSKSSPNSSMNFHCKMAGHTLDKLTDFLASIHFHDDEGIEIDHLNLPFLSFRFECGRLQDSPEFFRFLKVAGRQIRFLTVDVNHLRGKETVRSRMGEEFKWDHRYEVFRQIPNLQVLTLIPASRISPDSCTFDPELHAPAGDILPAENGHGGEEGPFHHLKSLRLQGRGDPSTGHFTLWILLKAKSIQRVVFEMGISPCLLLFLGASFDTDLGAITTPELLPPPVRLIIPITTLGLRIFEDVPHVLEFIAKVINLQIQQPHYRGRGQRSEVKTLHLYLRSHPERRDRSPYSSPSIPPLLKILKSVSESLETLSLVGGAALFLEGLLQPSNFVQQKEPKLRKFPNVRTLLLCHADLRSNLNHQNFRDEIYHDLDPDANSALTSTTSLSKVFPQLAQLDLDNHGFNDEETYLWTAFLPRPALFLELYDPGNSMDNQEKIEEDEVKSVKKLNIGYSCPRIALDVWKFSNVETLCLKGVRLSTVVPAIWSLRKVQTLMITDLPIQNQDGSEEFERPRLEATLTGLSCEVIREYIEELEKNLRDIPEGDLDLVLVDKRAAFRSLVQNGPSILDLGQMKHLKFFFNLWSSYRISHFFSVVSGLLLFDLLPAPCEITIWGRSSSIESPCNLEILKKAVSPRVSSHPRVTLKALLYGDHRLETAF